MPPLIRPASPPRADSGEPCRASVRTIALLCVAITLAAMPAVAAKKTAAKPAVENRCGWFINPTPANAWLIDRDGEWTVALQGGHQAEGPWPQAPSKKEWVAHEGDDRGYGYGCACMKIITDPDQTVVRILSAKGKPLAQCRRDPALAGTEPDYGSDS